MQPFVATTYQGKPAVFDMVARVYYFGFRSQEAARKKAADLNAGK